MSLIKNFHIAVNEQRTIHKTDVKCPFSTFIILISIAIRTFLAFLIVPSKRLHDLLSYFLSTNEKKGERRKKSCQMSHKTRKMIYLTTFEHFPPRSTPSQ